MTKKHAKLPSMQRVKALRKFVVANILKQILLVFRENIPCELSRSVASDLVLHSFFFFVSV